MQNRNIAIALASVLALSGGSAALAQTSQAPGQAPGQAAPAGAADVSDAKLDAFVVAFLKVEDVRQTFASKTEGMDENQKAQERGKAQKDMLQAVETTDGIDANEYNAIMRQAQQDPDLANKVNVKLQQKAGAR